VSVAVVVQIRSDVPAIVMPVPNVTAPATVSVPLNVSVLVYPVHVSVVQADAVSIVQDGEPLSKVATSPLTALVVLAGPALDVVLQFPSVDQLEFTPPFMKNLVAAIAFTGHSSASSRAIAIRNVRVKFIVGSAP
jgi:hypothetical protein